MNKKVVEKKVLKYSCDICDYNSSRKSDYLKHLETNKHKSKKSHHFDNFPTLDCKCGKTYSTATNLTRHHKKCIIHQKSLQLYKCELCNFGSNKKTAYKEHLMTLKHKSCTNATNDYKITTDDGCKQMYSYSSGVSNDKKIQCEKPDNNNEIIEHKESWDINGLSPAKMCQTTRLFCTCGKSYVYKRGLDRHQIFCKMALTKKGGDFPAKNGAENPHICICGKSYSHNRTLLTHQKTCPVASQNNTITSIKKSTPKQIIIHNNNIVNNNNTVNNYNNTNNTNNTVNNNFNIQNFLQNDCKNAMKIDTFMDELIKTITLDDIYEAAKIGMGPQIESKWTGLLKTMSQTERPMHCTDVKRQKIHVNDTDGWTSNNSIVKLCKCIDLVQDAFVKKYAGEYTTIYSPEDVLTDTQFEKHTNVIDNVFPDMTDHQQKKTVKQISTKTVIDK